MFGDYGYGFSGYVFANQSLLSDRTLVGFVADGKKIRREAGALPVMS